MSILEHSNIDGKVKLWRKFTSLDGKKIISLDQTLVSFPYHLIGYTFISL
jgi:hypothetical protein